MVAACTISSQSQSLSLSHYFFLFFCSMKVFYFQEEPSEQLCKEKHLHVWMYYCLCDAHFMFGLLISKNNRIV